MNTIDLRQPIDIEALLVWTYRRQRADVVIRRGMGLFDQEAALDPGVGEPSHRTSSDGVSTMQRIGLLGTRVDGGGASTSHLDRDAEIVHEAVSALPRLAMLLVIKHARQASRPDDGAIPLPRPVPVLYEGGGPRAGRPVVQYAPWDRHRNYGWCPIEWKHSPVTAEAMREEYALWYRTLTVLALALSGDTRLMYHAPQKPAAPAIATVRFN